MSTDQGIPPKSEAIGHNAAASVECGDLQPNTCETENDLALKALSSRPLVVEVVASNYALLLAGMNDAATGALLPHIKSSYDIGLLLVAIVYLVNFCGWLLAAFTNVHVTSHFGRGGALLLGACMQLLGYALNFWKPPFPLFVVSFFFSGLGVAYLDAQANTIVANMDNAHRWLGILHAVYGLGALVAPLIATTLASQTSYWHYFYLIMLGLCCVNVVLVFFAFRRYISRQTKDASTQANRQLKQALSKKAVWILCLFFFLYVGAEVTSGGWVVEFLISVRHGSSEKVGYVATGYWAGLTVGRVALADITYKLGQRRMVFAYILIAIALQFIFWFVRNIIVDAVAISLLGFVIGPFFPVGLSILTELLPQDLHIASIGFTATIGQAGSAAFPFLTGAVASRAGVIVLQPIMIGLLGGLFVLWIMIARLGK
ncbi:hypothetical protein FDECE_16370 [Fusarium decemcellulare]|nr:hypothetical protein FDECE_16370 [Fusarium decemcellulare]